MFTTQKQLKLNGLKLASKIINFACSKKRRKAQIDMSNYMLEKVQKLHSSTVQAGNKKKRKKR